MLSSIELESFREIAARQHIDLAPLSGRSAKRLPWV
jgi:hypothetical protein